MDAKELILELVNMVKELSPEVWAVYLLQVKVMLVKSYIMGGIALLIALVNGFLIKPAVRLEQEDSRWEAIALLPIILGGAALVTFVLQLLNIVSYTINPAYTAINLLLDIVK